jgi:hypothetical protein
MAGLAQQNDRFRPKADTRMAAVTPLPWFRPRLCAGEQGTMPNLFLVAFCVTVVYLFDFVRFSRKFAREQPELWRSLGSPETFGMQGQATYFLILFGAEKRVPAEVLQHYRSDLYRMRTLFLASFVLIVFAAAGV